MQRNAFLTCLSCGALAGQDWLKRLLGQGDGSDIFRKDAPSEELWELWKKRGWLREALYYQKSGRKVRCYLCPNECELDHNDRGHCRNRVNKDGTLYTLAYGNPCSLAVDPVEKKPLYHFLPGSRTFSLATSGCVFRCLNCQNWEISQKKPEETKNPRGNEFRLSPRTANRMKSTDLERLSLFPEDVAGMAEHAGCHSIAYTYSEPVSYYEYMLDSAKFGRKRGIRNIWVSCGSIQREALLELTPWLDGAHVDLKSFSEETYLKLNSGRLQPVLDTLRILKREGVWFEIIHLLVPTYTDNEAQLRRMCDWIFKELGPDVPLHFSRFHPQHKLLHLPPTPSQSLLKARDMARRSGLNFVYLGNVRDIPDAGTTYCPGCKKPVIERNIYSVKSLGLDKGRCRFCHKALAGIWS